MKVSVIIPEYRSGEMIYEAISSVFTALKKVSGESEVIVVLDGRGINFDLNKISQEDCERFNFKLIELPINMGGAAARNCGLTKATGKYVQFLDSDDLIFPDAINKKLNLSELNKGKCIIYGISRTIDEVRNKDGYVSGAESLSKVENIETYLRNNIQTSLPLYPKNLLEEINGFDPSLRMGQEFNLNLRLISKGVVFKNCRVESTLIRQRHDYSIGSNFYQSKFPLAKLYFLISVELILSKSGYYKQIYLFEMYFEEALKAKLNNNLILFDLAYVRCRSNLLLRNLYLGSLGFKVKCLAILVFGKYGFNVVLFLRYLLGKI